LLLPEIPSFDLLLSGSGDGTLRVWSYRTGKQISSLVLDPVNNSAIVSPLAFSLKTNTVVVKIEGENHLYLYHLETTGSLNLIQKFQLSAEPFDACFSSDGRTLFIVGKAPLLFGSFFVR